MILNISIHLPQDVVRLFVAHELTAEFKCGQSAMKDNNFDTALTTFGELYKKQREMLGESHVNSLDTLFHIGTNIIGFPLSARPRGNKMNSSLPKSTFKS